MHNLYQICYVTMSPSAMPGRFVVSIWLRVAPIMGMALMMMLVRVLEGRGRKFLNLTGKHDIHLDRPHAAAQYRAGVYLDIGESQPPRQLP